MASRAKKTATAGSSIAVGRLVTRRIVNPGGEEFVVHYTLYHSSHIICGAPCLPSYRALPRRLENMKPAMNVSCVAIGVGDEYRSYHSRIMLVA